MINKYYINQVASPSKEIINRLEELTKHHYILLNKYYEKSQGIRLAILYYLMVFSFIFVILSIGYQFLKWIWE